MLTKITDTDRENHCFPKMVRREKTEISNVSFSPTGGDLSSGFKYKHTEEICIININSCHQVFWLVVTSWITPEPDVELWN